ncbi:MAG: serine hydrolase [Bacteroidales bacterium]|nr:serine hydrolase [Bacteroidales bacterium]
MSRKRFIFSFLLAILLAIVLFIIFFPTSYVSRYVTWNFADVKDHYRFPYETITNKPPVFLFTEADNAPALSLPNKYVSKNCKEVEIFLQQHKTTAFLIIRNDTNLFEKYFEGYHKDSILPSFSVVKSVVSALTGIAINECFIESVKQPITDFFPELANHDNRFSNITIENLLNMRSGIKYNEGYFNPFADMAKFYYGTNLKKYTLDAQISEKPGQRYDYISVNTQLLALIIEKATEMPLNVFFEDKIWKPLGMENKATWNYDSEEHHTIKAFCCLNGCARDFARFGRLYLNYGIWRGEPVVPGEWVRRSTSIMNDSRDSQNYPYTYNWRVLDDQEAFFAKGILGQYVYVDRKKNLIFIRFGKGYAGIDWVDFFRELSEQL